MEHHEIDPIIDRFLQLSATAEEERTLSRWAKEDPANARYLRERQKIHHIACTSTSKDAGTEAELRKLMQSPAFAQGRTRRMYAVLSGAAAVAAVVFGLWIGLRNDNSATAPLAQAETIQYLPADSVQDLRLADGSSASVAAGTTVWAFAGKDGRRNVELQGKAYFEVMHDTARPFCVRAGSVRVTVLGTKFEVRQNADATTTVSVTEGKVRVEDTVSGFSTILTALQQVCVGADISPKTIDLKNENYLAWKTGHLQFADAPLGEALSDIGQAYGRRYLVASPALDSLRVNVAFDGRSSEQVEAVLQAMLGARFTHNDTAVLITKQP